MGGMRDYWRFLKYFDVVSGAPPHPLRGCPFQPWSRGRTDPNRGEAAPVLCRDSGCVVRSRDHLRDERRAAPAARLVARGPGFRLPGPLVGLFWPRLLVKRVFAPARPAATYLL